MIVAKLSFQGLLAWLGSPDIHVWKLTGQYAGQVLSYLQAGSGSAFPQGAENKLVVWSRRTSLKGGGEKEREKGVKYENIMERTWWAQICSEVGSRSSGEARWSGKLSTCSLEERWWGKQAVDRWLDFHQWGGEGGQAPTLWLAGAPGWWTSGVICEMSINSSTRCEGWPRTCLAGAQGCAQLGLAQYLVFIATAIFALIPNL